MSLHAPRTARKTRSTAIAGPRVPQPPGVAASGSRPVRVPSVTASASPLTPRVTRAQPRPTTEGRAWGNQLKAPPRDKNGKSRAVDQGPNGGRCLITNEKLDTQGCHVVGREYGNRNSKVVSLKEAWNMPDLDLDTATNIIIMAAHWHLYMDRGRFFLLPELTDIGLLIDHWASKNTSPIDSIYDGRKLFNYFVIAYKTDGIKELRRNGKTHFSPFIELGPLTSHLQPHFALVHAGDILASQDRDFFADFMSSAQQVLHSRLSASVISTMLMSVVFLREAWGNCVPETDVTAQSTVAVPKRSASGSQKDGSNQFNPLRSHRAKSYHGTENAGEDDHVSDHRGGGGKQNSALPDQPTDERYHTESPFISPSTSQEIANQKHAQLVHVVDTWAQGILASPCEFIEDECTTQEAAHELHFYRQENSPSEDAVKQRFGRQRFADYNIRSRWVPESDEASTSYSGDGHADLAMEENHNEMGVDF